MPEDTMKEKEVKQLKAIKNYIDDNIDLNSTFYEDYYDIIKYSKTSTDADIHSYPILLKHIIFKKSDNSPLDMEGVGLNDNEDSGIIIASDDGSKDIKLLYTDSTITPPIEYKLYDSTTDKWLSDEINHNNVIWNPYDKKLSFPYIFKIKVESVTPGPGWIFVQKYLTSYISNITAGDNISLLKNHSTDEVTIKSDNDEIAKFRMGLENDTWYVNETNTSSVEIPYADSGTITTNKKLIDFIVGDDLNNQTINLQDCVDILHDIVNEYINSGNTATKYKIISEIDTNLYKNNSNIGNSTLSFEVATVNNTGVGSYIIGIYFETYDTTRSTFTLVNELYSHEYISQSNNYENWETSDLSVDGGTYDSTNKTFTFVKDATSNVYSDTLFSKYIEQKLMPYSTHTFENIILNGPSIPYEDIGVIKPTSDTININNGKLEAKISSTPNNILTKDTNGLFVPTVSGASKTYKLDFINGADDTKPSDDLLTISTNAMLFNNTTNKYELWHTTVDINGQTGAKTVTWNKLDYTDDDLFFTTPDLYENRDDVVDYTQSTYSYSIMKFDSEQTVLSSWYIPDGVDSFRMGLENSSWKVNINNPTEIEIPYADKGINNGYLSDLIANGNDPVDWIKLPETWNIPQPMWHCTQYQCGFLVYYNFKVTNPLKDGSVRKASVSIYGNGKPDDHMYGVYRAVVSIYYWETPSGDPDGYETSDVYTIELTNPTNIDNDYFTYDKTNRIITFKNKDDKLKYVSTTYYTTDHGDPDKALEWYIEFDSKNPIMIKEESYYDIGVIKPDSDTISINNGKLETKLKNCYIKFYNGTNTTKPTGTGNITLNPGDLALILNVQNKIDLLKYTGTSWDILTLNNFDILYTDINSYTYDVSDYKQGNQNTYNIFQYNSTDNTVNDLLTIPYAISPPTWKYSGTLDLSNGEGEYTITNTDIDDDSIGVVYKKTNKGIQVGDTIKLNGASSKKGLGIVKTIQGDNPSDEIIVDVYLVQ